MKTSFKQALGILFLLLPAVALSGRDGNEAVGDRFTGEILTQLYVTDVRKSVAFYAALGFEHDYYYDYQHDTYSRKWNQVYAPEYAEVTHGKIRIGLTTAEEAEQVYGGGVRHYFMVVDVKDYYAMVRNNGIVPDPDEIEVRPWMSFFTVADPDKHQIVFGTKVEAYYDRARNELESLERQ